MARLSLDYLALGGRRADQAIEDGESVALHARGDPPLRAASRARPVRVKLLLALLLAGCATANAATVTAYCACVKCCGVTGGTGITASGKTAKQGVTIAASRSIPFGTRLRIEDVGVRVVQDRLSAKYNDRVDVFFNSHEAAQRFGKKTLKVTVLKGGKP